ncbi:hypothetical protein WA026_023678, partial [Henosepilachna vigintioctopunctata]
ITFGVHFILDSVTEALKKNKDRRFIYVETAFFWKWWTEQPDDIRHQFKQSVSSGQLEFIGGAWSMNDEATTHYQSIIDQFSWGLRKLNETFGECGRPKIGWQIDPFGHSREMASIFAQLGYDGLLLGRIDYQDKNNRFATKTPEVVWKASNNLGECTLSNISSKVLFLIPHCDIVFDCEHSELIDIRIGSAYMYGCLGLKHVCPEIGRKSLENSALSIRLTQQFTKDIVQDTVDRMNRTITFIIQGVPELTGDVNSEKEYDKNIVYEVVIADKSCF